MRREPVLQDMATDDCGVACLAFVVGETLEGARQYFQGRRTPIGGYPPREMKRALLRAGRAYEVVTRSSLAGKKKGDTIFLFRKWGKYRGKFLAHYVVWDEARRLWMDPLYGWLAWPPETARVACVLRPVLRRSASR